MTMRGIDVDLARCRISQPVSSKDFRSMGKTVQGAGRNVETRAHGGSNQIWDEGHLDCKIVTRVQEAALAFLDGSRHCG